ncbi:ribonuclease MC [Gossypium raimondii]|uniref:ribonuclease MC n=1 Tax=Gossypium raimondii TaxID=29730 RepID=UPI00227C6EB4|nr:ribonuclease MC [Gossypium raimondii]
MGGGESSATQTTFAVPQPPVIQVVDFYKLALQWPPSVCSSTLNCKLPIPTEFKIHGIWAQDARDTLVPPYDTHHPYTNPQPMTSQSDLRQLLISDVALWNQLPTLWPKLTSTGSDIGFWFKEWMKHGTCSDFAHHPLSYFQSAIQLRTNLNSVNTEELEFYYLGRCLSVMEDRGHPITLELPKIVPAYFTACAVVEPIP